ncbi:MAG: CRISPR-associated protein Csm7 [Magnetococcales bacterium]|nr:CRISPR-associated protein Csm7 [Magnetococcales bacterium]
MNTLLITLEPLTAFATPLHGDTLFGQLCWALRNRQGEAWLVERLRGYTANDPFLVVGDAFPEGHFPRPRKPSKGFQSKENRQQVWLPRREWGLDCVTEEAIWGKDKTRIERPQPHNSIHRLSGTTGEGEQGFAPFVTRQIWFPEGARLEVWLLHDADRLPEETLHTALSDIGQLGFGKEASRGLGKYRVTAMQPTPLPRQEGCNAWLTLGSCAPQGCGFDAANSFYELFTRFGRHGDWPALSGQPFKKPILMAGAGAVLTPAVWRDVRFVGQGLGGEGKLSKVIADTVHQGYCPVVGIRVD